MPSILEYFVRCAFWRMNHPFVWYFIKRRFNFIKADGSDALPKPLFVLVANHANFFDPWIIGFYSNYALFIMMNDDGFRGSTFQRWYLHAIGAFPKKKGAHDYKAMKYTLQLLKNGFPVMIFPEGQTSWDGETQPIYSGIEKIIKRAGCPLVMVRFEGNFLSKPWWAVAGRQGRIVITMNVLRPPELAALSEPQLLDTIRSRIYNNDIKNPQNCVVKFTGEQLALGLERFAWICRHCEAEDTLVTKGNNVSCTACSASWEMDPYCVLKSRLPTFTPIGDLHDWIAWHKQAVKKRLAANMPGGVLTRSTDVCMQSQGGRGEFVDRGAGALTLTKTELVFAPSDSSGQILRWTLETMEDYVIQAKDAFEFRAGKDYFRFVFDHHSPMKWVFYLRYLKGYDAVEQRGYY
jgi:hypothetical protein